MIRARQIDPQTLLAAIAMSALSAVLWTASARRITIAIAPDVPQYIGYALMVLWMARIAAPAATLWIVWTFVRRIREREWQAREALGLCGRCGYDIRASANLCPECGFPIRPRAGSGNPT